MTLSSRQRTGRLEPRFATWMILSCLYSRAASVRQVWRLPMENWARNWDWQQITTIRVHRFSLDSPQSGISAKPDTAFYSPVPRFKIDEFSNFRVCLRFVGGWRLMPQFFAPSATRAAISRLQNGIASVRICVGALGRFGWLLFDEFIFSSKKGTLMPAESDPTVSATRSTVHLVSLVRFVLLRIDTCWIWYV